jgi:cell division protein FtsW (lipid II flippase)
VIADLPLIGIGLALSLYGLATVYSAGQTDVVTVAHYAWRSQIVWIGVAVAGAYVVSRAPIRLLDWLTIPMYLLSVLLLMVLLVPGIGGGAGTAASSKSWLVIAGHRVGQPSELAKITVVLMLARVLSAKKDAP